MCAAPSLRDRSFYSSWRTFWHLCVHRVSLYELESISSVHVDPEK